MEGMSMQKLSNSSILKILSRLLILLVIAKVISLVILYLLPSDGVELSIEDTYQPKYQRVDFKNMLISTKTKTSQQEKEVVQSGVNITNMVLRGLYGINDSGFIIVALKTNTKDTTIVEVGDIYSGYKLTKIEKTSAILSKGNTKYTLHLDTSEVDFKYKKSKSTSLNNNDEIISQKVVSKRDIQHYAKNPKQIWREISIIEVKQGKEIKGFKVTRIDPKSKMATLGLKKGDLIIKANNVELKSYRDALNIYAKIKDIDLVQIVVIRNGVQRELVYEIN
jgi:type II secretion system protein C